MLASASRAGRAGGGTCPSSCAAVRLRQNARRQRGIGSGSGPIRIHRGVAVVHGNRTCCAGNVPLRVRVQLRQFVTQAYMSMKTLRGLDHGCGGALMWHFPTVPELGISLAGRLVCHVRMHWSATRCAPPHAGRATMRATAPTKPSRPAATAGRAAPRARRATGARAPRALLATQQLAHSLHAFFAWRTAQGLCRRPSALRTHHNATQNPLHVIKSPKKGAPGAARLAAAHLWAVGEI